ncbi:MAG: rhodanese-like domain-containing protein, partial [Burkholderiaceae bacterium]|nr:rhodanese-like domain-containing protein [Burkholderiaceae bacterium]
MASTAIPAGPLVSTEWLSQNLDNPKVRVIEVSVNPGLYERAHVPGAVNFSWHNDLNDKVRRDIVGKQGFETLLSKAGVAPDTTVVLYGDTNNWFAAWGAW